MLCPADTPEGEACGLVKNLALMTHITTDDEEQPLRQLAFNLGIEGSKKLFLSNKKKNIILNEILILFLLDVNSLTGAELYRKNAYMVFLNGLMLGITCQPNNFVHDFRRLRRCSRISEFVSIYVNHHHNAVHIASDGGRVCRPLIIVENRTPKVTTKHIQV
jgi:DNA-directed RNA polymerase III subunit RPC2